MVINPTKIINDIFKIFYKHGNMKLQRVLSGEVSLLVTVVLNFGLTGTNNLSI